LLLFSTLLSPLINTAGCGIVQPKNIILCIADGCGYNQIIAASIYKYGQESGFAFQKFPVALAMSTHSANGETYNPRQAWKRFKYVLNKPTESAAAATAMASGQKTNNGVIAMSPEGDRLETIAERAEKMNKSSGVVTSVQFSHATPACFAAHNMSRSNYVQISQDMILNSRLDVIMGCGHPDYDNNGISTTGQSFKYVGGQETWTLLINDRAGNDADGDGETEYWHLIQQLDEFTDLMTGETPERVIGIPQVHSTLQQSRGGDEYAEPYVVAKTEGVPNLSQMVTGAVNVLDNNPNGFFLMIEGGAVDWASHDNQSGRAIEEEIDFAEAVDKIISWVENNSSWDETLVIVTGDHETGYLTGPGSGIESSQIDQNWKSIKNVGKSKQPELEWHTHGHSNSLIPVFAKGIGSDLFHSYADETDPIRGKYIDNTEIGMLMFDLWK
jgi:alkaline phosphatase